jgi:hypothetical protein
VLGHRRPADRQLFGQLSHGAGVPSQQLEDRAPGWVTEKTQTGGSVSVHERLGYTYQLPRRKRFDDLFGEPGGGLVFRQGWGDAVAGSQPPARDPFSIATGSGDLPEFHIPTGVAAEFTECLGADPEASAR